MQRVQLTVVNSRSYDFNLNELNFIPKYGKYHGKYHVITRRLHI